MPLPRMFAANLSKRTDVREPIEPVPEEYAGHNNAYRGIEAHGVEPTEEYESPPTHTDGRPVVYEPDKEEQEPVPVRIVGTFARERRLARTDTVTVLEGQKVRILGADDKRISALIRNMDDAETVYIGFTDQITVYSGGYPLESNSEMSLVAQGDVWILYPEGTATEVRIGFLTQYTVELP
jgi:hypothetical protein